MKGRSQKPPVGKPQLPEDQARKLAANVGIELTMAGAQILREEFGFSQAMIDAWLEKTLARAKANRDPAPGSGARGAGGGR